MAKIELKWADVDVVLFRRSRGNGGQHNNKTATAVRMTHRSTGLRVECCSDRSQRANKETAFAQIRLKLQKLADDRRAAERRSKYDAQPDAAFGRQVRTYHLIERTVVDHRTGFKGPSDRVLERGELDSLIRSSLANQGGRR